MTNGFRSGRRDFLDFSGEEEAMARAGYALFEDSPYAHRFEQMECHYIEFCCFLLDAFDAMQKVRQTFGDGIKCIEQTEQ